MPLIAGGQMPGPGLFGNIDSAAAKKAQVPRRGRHIGEHGELNPFWADDALFQGTHDLVVAAGEGELEFTGHAAASPYPERAGGLPCAARGAMCQPAAPAGGPILANSS